MVNALHLISVQRGYDPRDFVLVAFGGAGPVHANALARDAEMPTLLVPAQPRHLLGDRPAHDRPQARRLEDRHASARRARRRTRSRPPSPCSSGPGPPSSQREGLARDAIEFVAADRHALRRPELRADDPTPGRFDASSVDALLERFHAEHDRLYGFSAPTEPTECVSLRLTTVGRIAKPPLQPLDSSGGARAQGAPPRLLRRVRRLRRLPDLRPLRAARRRPASPGPAVIEEFDSTTIVHPGYAAEVDDLRKPDHQEGGTLSDGTESSSRRT